MQIVIDIPKCYYEIIKKKTDETVSEQRIRRTFMGGLCEAVAKGTPLPASHGRLIDADAISLDDIGFFSMSDYQKMVHKLTTSCPTIIEADNDSFGGEK